MYSTYNNSTSPLLFSEAIMRPINFNRQETRQTNSIAPPLNSVSPPSIRRRNQLGNPNPNAEVIELSPDTITTTRRFICKECDQGFVREQNLELHGRKHGLPWNLQKQNSNQEKRRKVYVCPEPTCVHHDPARALGDMTAIKKHFLRKHGEKKYKCDKCPKVYAVLSDMNAHSKICGTKKYSGTNSSRNPSAAEMATPPNGGGRSIFYGGAASGFSPSLGSMARNGQNIMNFGENIVPPVFTNGGGSAVLRGFGDRDNGNLLGIMNSSAGGTIDHQSRSDNILDLFFGNNLNIGGSNRMPTMDLLDANGGINGQDDYDGRRVQGSIGGGLGGYLGRGVQGSIGEGPPKFGMRFGHPNYPFGSG